MYTLQNDALTVSVLDPVVDQERFGTRYCTGGYIFQVADAQLGDLLSGPTFPESFNWFDGQGLPEAFNRGPLREVGSDETEALIIGVGPCDLAADRVLAFCTWEVQENGTEIWMRTEQAFQNFALELTRTVRLSGRTVRSETQVVNVGKAPLPIRWFPHPFFPHVETDELCRFNIPVQFAENAGFAMGDNGFVCRKNWPWDRGYFQALDHDARTNLIVVQRHPKLGMVAATCSYVPSFFPIWGNANTFSWEPYFERTLFARQTLTWWIDYDF